MATAPKPKHGLEVWIDAKDLVKFVQNTLQAPPAIRQAAARALNAVGDQVVNDVAAAVAAQTGMERNTLIDKIIVTRASANRPTYTINAASALIDMPATRPMRGQRRFRQRPNDYFYAEEIVNIVTFGDERVCELCQQLEEEGPYTIEEARALIPAHPHCRCAVQSTKQRRELPVAFRKGQTAQVADVTMDKIVEQVLKETELALKAHYNARS